LIQEPFHIGEGILDEAIYAGKSAWLIFALEVPIMAFRLMIIVKHQRNILIPPNECQRDEDKP
jgi:hypothetical protein